MKKILIIGANSNIGKELYQYAQENYNDSLSLDLISGSSGEWNNIDFNIYDTVLLLSAIVHRKETKNIKEQYTNVNHYMAVDIAKKAKQNKVKQFIFMSSAAVYGDKVECIKKDTIPNPTTYYGKSKLDAEKDIIKLKSKEYKVAIIRPPMVYGDGCKGNYAKLVKLAKYAPIFPNVDNKRSVIHIITLVEFLIKLLQSQKGGYYFPQEKKYKNTSQWIVDIRKDIGKKTLLVNGLNNLLKFIGKYFKTINKMFSSFYYEI